MNTQTADLGVLTLATPHDYLKAIGLAMSLRISNPGLPLAVACAAEVKPLLAPHFDHVVEELPGLRGFVHKVHLDTYTPFAETLFFDSDVLVFKPVQPYLTRWGPRPYTACGGYMRDGVSCFGLDRAAVLQRIGKPQLVVIDGAGHAYFRKAEGAMAFARARAISDNYPEFAPGATYADEDVMNIVMSWTWLLPPSMTSFRASSARNRALSRWTPAAANAASLPPTPDCRLSRA
jgi:hypothetical protein